MSRQYLRQQFEHQNHTLALVFCFLFSLPYFSGVYAFAPTSYLNTSVFHENVVTSARDEIGPTDYLEQERNFLKNYKIQLTENNFPFYDEKMFGGISHQDSAIFSYLNPLNIIFFIIDNEFIAKGIQIFFVLYIWWYSVYKSCLIFQINPKLASLLAMTVAFSPQSLGYLTHSHQLLIYAVSILLVFHILGSISTDKTNSNFEYFKIFVLMILAISFNFISVLAGVGIYLLIGLGFYWICCRFDRQILIRIFKAGLAVLAALTLLIFFWIPIFLDVYEVRENVILGEFARGNILESGGLLLSSFSFFGWGSEFFPAFFWVVTAIFLLKWGTHTRLAKIFFVCCIPLILAVWFPEFGDWLRLLLPVFKKSLNIFDRLLFVISIILMIIMIKQIDFDSEDKSIFFIFNSFLIGIVCLVTFVLLNGLNISWGSKLSGHILERGLIYPLIMSCFVVIGWVLWIKNERIRFISCFCVGIGFLGCWIFQFPNLKVEELQTRLEIYGSNYIGKNIIVRSCIDQMSPYTSGPRLIETRSLNSGTDLGLAKSMQEFWSRFNNIDKLNDAGANYFEVSWVCAKQAFDEKGEINRFFDLVIKLLGVETLFVEDPVRGGFQIQNINPICKGACLVKGFSVREFEDLFKSDKGRRKSVFDMPYEKVVAKMENVEVRRENNVLLLSPAASGVVVTDFPCDRKSSSLGFDVSTVVRYKGVDEYCDPSLFPYVFFAYDASVVADTVAIKTVVPAMNILIILSFLSFAFLLCFYIGFVLLTTSSDR